MIVEKMRLNLESAGFNLFSVLESSALVGELLPDNCQSIILIGNAGTKLWERLPAHFLDREHPIDDYSRETIDEILQQTLPAQSHQFLFPAVEPDLPPPLQKLGEIAGWHNPSPLGQGINRKYGLWFAYRAVVAVNFSLSATKFDRHPSPCLTCSGTPCVAGCPASALAVGRNPELRSCVKFRSQTGSPCEESCLARLSCPVASQWRYSDEQLSYHYRRSLPSLLKWVADET